MIITLLTDIGTRDPNLAIAKAVLMNAVPNAEIADLTHNVPAQGQRDAAPMLAAAWHYYPAGTVHIVPIALFVGKRPAMTLVKWKGHYFIAPDNGLLPLALGGEAVSDARLCQTYSKPYEAGAWLRDAAQLAARIFNGDTLPATPIGLQTLKPLQAIVVTPTSAVSRVLRVDRYGNVTFDMTHDEFMTVVGNRPFSIEMLLQTENESAAGKMAEDRSQKKVRVEHITTISRHYSDVPKGHSLCRFNKAGRMEISVNHGSAVERLQLDISDLGRLYYNTMRIRF